MRGFFYLQVVSEEELAARSSGHTNNVCALFASYGLKSIMQLRTDFCFQIWKDFYI